ncbi:RNA-binding S4 domain-containing protein [Egibacter rhizosphaerae]|uniref:RNA-binding S4 domain-containing protein n=1 Tax=Egibacter rhizosphaerae TaxID=1670831 RepID=UPI001F0D2DFF|nr:RNA-binding S4 domain-containing protein [Egibacter rhizosphaerae]
MESARVDRWLWAVRLCKTRSQATEACRAGHVEVNDRKAKPASTVRVGDTVRAWLHGRERVVEVARIIDERVGAPVARECVVDHSPPPPPREAPPPGARRPRGAGRPTKRERRQLDQWWGRRGR